MVSWLLLLLMLLLTGGAGGTPEPRESSLGEQVFAGVSTEREEHGVRELRPGDGLSTLRIEDSARDVALPPLEAGERRFAFSAPGCVLSDVELLVEGERLVAEFDWDESIQCVQANMHVVVFDVPQAEVPQSFQPPAAR